MKCPDCGLARARVGGAFVLGMILGCLLGGSLGVLAGSYVNSEIVSITNVFFDDYHLLAVDWMPKDLTDVKFYQVDDYAFFFWESIENGQKYLMFHVLEGSHIG